MPCVREAEVLFSPDSVIVSAPRYCWQIKIIKSSIKSGWRNVCLQRTLRSVICFFTSDAGRSFKKQRNLHSSSRDDAGENSCTPPPPPLPDPPPSHSLLHLLPLFIFLFLVFLLLLVLLLPALTLLFFLFSIRLLLLHLLCLLPPLLPPPPSRPPLFPPDNEPHGQRWNTGFSGSDCVSPCLEVSSNMVVDQSLGSEVREFN